MNIFKQIKKIIKEEVDKSFNIKRYKSIYPKSFMESIEFNGFNINRTNDINAKTIYINSEKVLKEIIDTVFEQKGGIVVFSVSVNAKKTSKNKIINFIKNNIQTIKNRMYIDKKINKVISKYDDIYGITIGNFVKGRYKSDDGDIYNEKSLSIEIIGIDSNTLNVVAENLNKEFNQEKVLVKNYDNNKIYLVK